jgi:hypothetical protein
MRRTTHTAALTLCLALAAGCAAAPTVSTGTSPSASSAANDLGADLPTATGSPTWDDHTAAEAAATADAATAAFIRKDLPDDQWGPQLAVLLTPAAAAAYLGPNPTRPTTDPANVPGQALRGGSIAGSTAPVNRRGRRDGGHRERGGVAGGGRVRRGPVGRRRGDRPRRRRPQLRR